MEQNILEHIDSPADLKKLSMNDLPRLCEELRSFIIKEVAANPGHLGANLGVIELTVALHYVLNTPYDRVIWDVGHQAYAHKILTGRRERFPSNRKLGGISGFPSPRESEYDSFGTGHSSTSVSAGLGMAVAAALKNEDERNIVAVIGDGSLTGGLAFEGLNNVSIDPNNLLIVVNDNNMAIDPISGGLNKRLTNMQLSPAYNRIRWNVYKLLRKLRIITPGKRSKLIRFANSLKGMMRMSSTNNIFEGLNIRYSGPIDGHDISFLVPTLQELVRHRGPKVLHIITQKGKGYTPAEQNATTWHAPGKFNPQTGERLTSNDKQDAPPLFQDVFGYTLLDLAEKDPNIVGVTPAMPSGCSMTYMMQAYPERTFDVGIAEGHAVTFSAGMAKDGLLPFCNIYSSFMQRAYDNVVHDVALQSLHVVLCLDRAGIVGNDGATHHGAFDIAIFKPIPNIIIAAPRNEIELRNLMYTAAYGVDSPFIIRYPRGKGVLSEWRKSFEMLPIGKGEKLKEGKDVAIIGAGPLLYVAKEAIENIEKEGRYSVALYDMRFVKPLDKAMLDEIAHNYSSVISIEDGVRDGGLGSSVIEYFMDRGYDTRVRRLGIPDHFVEHGSQQELYHILGLDAEGIGKSIMEVISISGKWTDKL